MAKVLMAWELGANFGHLARQVPLAQRLRADGHEVLFAVRDTESARSVLTPAGFRFVQAPIHVGRVSLKRAPANYSELLLAEGYGDLRSLHGRLLAWRSLFELFGAQAMVVDHGPTALLAARSARLAAIAVGNGFELPPRVSPLPNIKPEGGVSEEQLRRSDEIVLRYMNECLRTFAGTAPLERVADLFPVEGKVLATFPELDPYGERSSDTYFGPLFSSVASERVQWQSSQGPRILAYLRNGSPGLKNLLASLKATRAEVLCVLPGIGRRLSRALSDGPFRVLPHAVNLPPVVEAADLVVHSGSGTGAQALLAGVPVLTLPSNFEQYAHAKRIEALGAGIAVGTQRTRDDFDGVLNGMLSNATYRARAREFAHRHAEFSTARIVDHAAALVDRAVQRRSEPLH